MGNAFQLGAEIGVPDYRISLTPVVSGVRESAVSRVTFSGTRLPHVNRDLALALIRSFRLGDAAEQAENLASFMQGLDDERPEGQKLCPES